jgi:hypothetical protein
MPNFTTPEAIEMLNKIEAIIREGGADSYQLGGALHRSPATMCSYLRELWIQGRIKAKSEATNSAPAFWVIGCDPNAGRKSDAANVLRVTVKTWPPHHKRGVLECLWWGVPVQMVVAGEASCG